MGTTKTPLLQQYADFLCWDDLVSNASGHIQKDHAAYAAKELVEKGLANWEVVVAEENQLQIDYDSPTLPDRFFDVLKILQQRFPTAGLCYSNHRSKGGNQHVLINLPHKIGLYERIAWQAAFGSDCKREALHLLSVSRKEKNPILLFMEKGRETNLIPVEAVGRKYRTEE